MTGGTYIPMKLPSVYSLTVRHSRTTSSPSTSSTSSETSKASEAGSDVSYKTEIFSGFLADFFAEYDSPKGGLSPAGADARGDSHTSGAETAHDPLRSPREETESVTSHLDWRSDSAHDYSSDSERETEDASTVAETDDNWEDEDVDVDTPGSPGSDIEVNNGVLRRGMYITVILSNRERGTALPCVAKVLEIHDRRGKFTIRLSKSARRATRTMFGAPGSSVVSRGVGFSPRP